MLELFVETLLGVLDSSEDACCALLSSHGIDPGASVDLIIDELTGYEALCYAKSLLELGREVEAEEVLLAVIAAGWIDRPQGSQTRVIDVPQGSQYIN